MRLTKASNLQAPASFDARDKWPTWFWPVRDQGKCMASYAIAVVEILSIR